MEEELVLFDESIKNQSSEKEFWAVYNEETGKIIGVYPNKTADAFLNKIKIDNELAESIQQGLTSLDSCSVDLYNDELVILESQPLIKIDDVLHRVIEKKWAHASDFDLYLKYNQKNKTFKVSLSDKFFGKKKTSSGNTKHRIRWDENTEISLLLTEYNDPNVLYYTIELKLEEIISKDKIFKNIDLPKHFSVYTKRLFKNYVIEIV
jgi:hypothetical protein